ncbi:alginate O-acetyltransferase [Pseudomonas sp. LS44]|uniref:alginate O-acetyltransferase n=1 Tax=Pseudomonas sp. LS44 TaxID=1357074 RepID=UPI00215B4B33|nr:alginate O-acetyltransferase [Pseudomonas sp. LS44]UVE16869.1 alginate O-acetyltransferase [Pseudomonas sp. LS44]
MNRSLRIFYSALFLALLLVLGGLSLRAFSDYSVPPGTTWLDGKWAKALETRYDAEFPLKRLGTNLWAALDYTLFEEGRPGVILGRQDWLFSDEEFKPVARGEQHIEDNLRLIRGVQQTLEQRGIELLLVIVPAKARVYPEYLAEEQPARLQRGLYRRFHADLAKADIAAPDLLAMLQQGKANTALFLRTDTHWTPQGAELVAAHLARIIQREAPLSGAAQQFVTDIDASRPYHGDLTRFLPLDPLFSKLLPPPDPLQVRSTRAVDSGQADEAAALFADLRIPLVLVGTSYSANPNWNFLGALRQALGSDLLSYAEDGHGPLLPMLKYLQTDAFKDSPPQLVIWEFPERYLPMATDLSQLDPQSVEQLKAAAAPGQRLTATAK